MKKTMKGIIGMIALLVTAGTIGWIIGDYCGLDMELFGELVLLYIPPIIGSIYMTLFVKEKNVVNKTEGD